MKLRHLGLKKNVRSNKTSANSETTPTNYIVMFQEDSTPSDEIKSENVLNNEIKNEGNLSEFNTETGEMQTSGGNSPSAQTEPMINSNIVSEIDPSLVEASESQLNNLQKGGENQLGEMLQGNEGLDIQNLIQSQHLAYDEEGNIVMSQDYFIVRLDSKLSNRKIFN